MKGSIKALGPVGVALSYYNNFDEAEEAGRATVDTVVDTACRWIKLKVGSVNR